MICMLNIYLGPMKEAIYDKSSYFNNVYLDSWLTGGLSQDIIRSVIKQPFSAIMLSRARLWGLFLRQACPAEQKRSF